MVNLLTIKFILLNWAQKQESRMHVKQRQIAKNYRPVHKAGKQLWPK